MDDFFDQGQGSPQDGLHINSTARNFLRETAKWSKFLSILGFVGIGFMVIAAFAMGAIVNSVPGMNTAHLPGFVFTLIYLISAAIYFMPVLYLFQFSQKMNAGLQGEDEAVITEGFRALKSHYRYMGIMMIVVMSLYALLIVFGVIGAIITAATI